VERGESFAELVTPQGAVLDSTPPIGRTLLLGPADLRDAGRHPHPDRDPAHGARIR